MRSSLALIAAVLVVVLVGYFAGTSSTVENTAPTASSTGLSVLPSVTLPALALPNIVASSTASSTAPKVAKTPAKKASPIPAPTPLTTTTTTSVTTTPVATAASLDASASEVRSALVNIICNAPYGSGLESISGSGVFIDARGIILTNAHIGQYFLLSNLGVRCIVRTGSPAEDAYYASLAFISPAWLSANSAALTETSPTGTGEHDIAVLAVTRSATGTPLPSPFPYAPLAQDPPALNEQVVIGSYAAQFLEASSIENSLYPTIVYGSIKDVFTFLTNTIDVVSLGGSAAAQEGSSGGGVLDASGKLVATITTSTTQGATADRELNAITASYIRGDYASETGTALDTLLAEQPSQMVSHFAPQIPSLEAIITADLSN